MSHAVSSSDSEDESYEASTKQQKSQEQNQKASKFECPADFVPYKYSSSSSALLDNREHTELWLIKAPARFDPKRLAGLKVSLSGLEMIQTADGMNPQFYSVLGSAAGPTDLHLLTSSCKNRDVSLSASGFSGVLSISESYGDCSGNQHPIAIPTAPAPSIPPGLRQRFQPFGSSGPAIASEQSASASPSPPKRAKLGPEESEEPRKRNKKKKKEKRSREENINEMHIKQEEVSYDYTDIPTPEPVDDEGTAERRKKKKVKKERRDGLGEVVTDAGLFLKEEPADTSCRDIDSPVKKKKKKKKKKKIADE